MKYLLVKVKANYADEFDVEGFIVISETEWNKSVALLKATFPFTYEIYFGTNEQIYFESFKDFERVVNVQEITKEQVKVITDLFYAGSGIHKFAYGLGGEIILNLFNQSLITANENEPND